jgi:hypothetical protein
MTSRLPRNLSLALGTVEAIAAITLLRSVVLNRWTTVFAALALLVGARAALRERTWGIGVVLAVATAFPVAVLLGFAPPWFWAVGAVGVVPFLLTVRPMARFDAAAATLFGVLATGTGIAGAFAWREVAYAMFFAMQHHHHHACH